MYPSLLKIGEKHLYPAKSFSQLTGCLSIKKCINAMTFKFINNVCPYSLIEIYEYSPQCRIESRSNFAKLKVPFRIIIGIHLYFLSIYLLINLSIYLFFFLSYLAWSLTCLLLSILYYLCVPIVLFHYVPNLLLLVLYSVIIYIIIMCLLHVN